MSNKKLLKNTLVGITALAAAPVYAKSGGGTSEGGKSQCGVNHLSLEMMPGKNTIMCANSTQQASISTDCNMTPNDLTVAVDPFSGNYFEVVFTVGDILARDADHVMFLVYSPRISPSPQMPTPKSLNKLELDLAPSEIMAMYDMPAQVMMAQPTTRLGAGNPAPRSKVSFTVNLDNSTLPTFMNNSEKVYLQAALLKKADFNAGNYSNMILSELNTMTFVQNTCPSDTQVEMAGSATGAVSIAVTAKVSVSAGGSVTVK